MPDQPRLNWGLHGHSTQLGLLQKAFIADSLAHAYVLAGPSQVGKRTAARRLAQFLLCESGDACATCGHCTSLLAGSNADYMEVLPDAGVIKIEPIRDLSYKLALLPYDGKRKIAVIDDAHLMTQEASNALLKVLEEPKSGTHLILITDNPHRLLPTISSRAQKISFGPVDAASFSEWLTASNLPAPDPAFTGRPGHVLATAADPDSAQVMSESSESLGHFVSGSLGRKLLLAQELAERETPELKALLEHWLHHLRHRLLESPDQNLAGKIQGVIRAQRMLDQNANSKLLLTEMMLQT